MVRLVAAAGLTISFEIDNVNEQQDLQRPGFTPHCIVVHPVACVKNVVSMQRHVVLDARHAVWLTAAEKQFNW